MMIDGSGMAMAVAAAIDALEIKGSLRGDGHVCSPADLPVIEKISNK